jgi:transposase
MEILYTHCAGLDVHKESISACVLSPGPGADPNKQIREFGTTTGELRRWRNWLQQGGVTHAAMESTGVYWKPVFNILEDACVLIVVNARHIKQVPGRKSRQQRPPCQPKKPESSQQNPLRSGLNPGG